MNWLRRWWRKGWGWKWGHCCECGGEAEVDIGGRPYLFCLPCRNQLRIRRGLPPISELERD